MADFLADDPLLLLFACLAIGSLAGAIRVRGFMLGPAAVLFAALALSAWDARLELPPVIGQLGLAVFAYCIGVASGSAFFGALRSGLGTILAISGLIGACGALAYGVGRALGLGPELIAGIFAGGLTNTPALAAATEAADGATAPTVGYSVTYLAGVVVMMLLAQWALGPRSRSRAREADPARQAIVNVTLEVTATGLPPVGRFAHDPEHPVLFSRVRHGDALEVPDDDTLLEPGDVVSAIGHREDVEAVASQVGVPTGEPLTLDRTRLDMRRITMSRRALSGLTVRQLDLPARFGALASRVRRGDVDLLATDDLVVQQGDRIRVIAPRARMAEVAHHLGDSERGPADLNPIGLSLGLCMGLLLGLVPLPSPAGGTFAIGLAAGPLLVGLVLGRLSRTGPVVWAVPYSASIALQQLGVLLFLATAGSRAGGALVDALGSPEGGRIFLAGLIVTLSAAGGLLVRARPLGLGGPRLAGIVAGAQTQPAVLAFAQEKSSDQAVGLGYALIYPAAMIVKILVAQLLVLM
jgi:putative transport protein